MPGDILLPCSLAFIHSRFKKAYKEAKESTAVYPDALSALIETPKGIEAMILGINELSNRLRVYFTK